MEYNYNFSQVTSLRLYFFFCSIAKIVLSTMTSLYYEIIVPYLPLQTQEREAKAEMRKKAKELQLARREAERLGKKPPGYGNCGSSFGTTGQGIVSSAPAILTDMAETERPKLLSSLFAAFALGVLCWASKVVGCVTYRSTSITRFPLNRLRSLI